MDRRNLLQTTFLSSLAIVPFLPQELNAQRYPGENPELEKIFGKIQFVDSFPDFKVKVVDSFADLHVKCVDSFPNAPGKWKIVKSFPDFKIQIVKSFPDFTIKYVQSFPGVR